jgi:hypothetical protein
MQKTLWLWYLEPYSKTTLLLNHNHSAVPSALTDSSFDRQSSVFYLCSDSFASRMHCRQATVPISWSVYVTRYAIGYIVDQLSTLSP